MTDAYLGNPNLKKVNTPVEYSKEQIIEYEKCANDPIYFMEEYVRIVSLDEGLVPFKMYPFQRHIVKTIHDNRFTICKLPRQSGKSTTTISYLLHYALFNPNSNVAILANKSSTARDILGRLQLAYENLPKWLQQGVINWNKGNIELETNQLLWRLQHLQVQFEVVLLILFSLTSLLSYRLILPNSFSLLFILQFPLVKVQR